MIGKAMVVALIYMIVQPVLFAAGDVLAFLTPLGGVEVSHLPVVALCTFATAVLASFMLGSMLEARYESRG